MSLFSSSHWGSAASNCGSTSVTAAAAASNHASPLQMIEAAADASGKKRGKEGKYANAAVMDVVDAEGRFCGLRNTLHKIKMKKMQQKPKAESSSNAAEAAAINSMMTNEDLSL